MKKLLLGTLAVTSLTAATQAATINIAFHSSTANANAMDTRPDGTIVRTSVDTWNNPVGTGATIADLNDSTGAATGSSLAVSAGFNASNNIDFANNSDDWVMMNSWIGLAITESVTITNLSSDFTTGGYNVTIYGGTGATARTMNYTVNGSATGQIVSDGTRFSGTFDDDATPNAADFNFVTLSGGTNSTLTILGNQAGQPGRSAINGIVIESIPVPEPSSTALLGLGGLALVLRRKR